MSVSLHIFYSFMWICWAYHMLFKLLQRYMFCLNTDLYVVRFNKLCDCTKRWFLSVSTNPSNHANHKSRLTGGLTIHFYQFVHKHSCDFCSNQLSSCDISWVDIIICWQVDSAYYTTKEMMTMDIVDMFVLLLELVI